MMSLKQTQNSMRLSLTKTKLCVISFSGGGSPNHNPSCSQPIRQSGDQSVGQPIGQSGDQSVGQVISQSGDQSVGQVCSQLGRGAGKQT